MTIMEGKKKRGDKDVEKGKKGRKGETNRELEGTKEEHFPSE